MDQGHSLTSRLLRSPVFWLGLQGLGVLLYIAGTGGLLAELGPDSPGFRWKFSSGDVQYFLTSKRTFGYPAFLSLVESLSGGVAAVGAAQLVFYLGSVMLLGWAGQRFFGAVLPALGLASPLLYFKLLPWLTRQVASDLLAAAFAVATLAFFLCQIAPESSSPRGRLSLVGMGVFLFLAYQTRPSYLFLVPLLPLAGLALTTWRGGPQGWRGAIRHRLLPLGLVAVLPFLGWCSLRFVLVGEFGLVSFGGMNVIGITAPMVTPEIVPSLPQELQLFGQKLIRQRARRGLAPLEPEVSYRRWRNEFNDYAHFVSAEALLRTVGGKPGTTKAPWAWANRFYGRFSLAMIRLRPDLYARWLLGASGETARWVAKEPVIRGAGLMSVFGLIFALARHRSRWAPSPASRELLLLALAWALAGQLLVIAVEVPLARYNLANFMVLPGALLAFALDGSRSRTPPQ